MAGYWYALVHELTVKLVRFPSVTNTSDEEAFATHLRDLLSSHTYFSSHPEQVRVEPTRNDLFRRATIFALVRGSSARTVVLTGHYDVVDILNYGTLAPWAFEAEALLPRLIASLEMERASESSRLALHDLQSGLFMPGRGALDMKSGLAAGIAVLFHFAQATSPSGNLLLVATPDEEEASHGIRSAVATLSDLASEWGLDLIAAINLDATDDQGDGRDGQAIFLGSVGKLLPSVYIAGRDTHAGSPFSGINANLLAAEVTRRLECNMDWTDFAEGEWSPPPVNLKQCDLKDRYDVTTPSAAWCLYNILTHSRSATLVLGMMRSLVQETLEVVVARQQEQARRFGALTGRTLSTPAWQPLVLTFAELKERALSRGGTEAEQALADLTRTFVEDRSVDLPQLSLLLTSLLWRFSGLSGPAAVVGFASLYYPHIQLNRASLKGARLYEAATRQAQTFSQETGTSIHLRPFFPGISDMSFLGSAVAPDDLAVMAANTPAWGSRIRFDYQQIQALDLPTINIGPWGRDYHQRTERVYMPYSFGLAPELIWRICTDLLQT